MDHGDCKMCGYSNNAAKKTDASKGVKTTLGTVGSHGHRGFMPVSETSGESAVCVKCGTTMRLRGIPADFQQEHGVGASEVVRFDEVPVVGWGFEHMYDAVTFSNGKTVLLNHLPEGISAEVLAMPGETWVPTDEAVKAIIGEAVAGAVLAEVPAGGVTVEA